MRYEKVISLLKSMENPRNVEGMKRFGIRGKKMLGISVYDIRRIAKDIGKDHSLALKLWDSGIHEARMLACFVGEPEKVTESLMEKWVRDFDSWDICDQCCSNLFDQTPFVGKKIREWTSRKEEFVKRSGFVLICAKSVHDKKASDKEFERYFPIIKREAKDERNFVKKAVNWALRQIGKRNLSLNKKAIKVAKELEKSDSKSERWIAKDALKELTSEKIRERLKTKNL
ncbi:MAG: DNA alkylation repair protein [Candidatus Aenigmarchaeota archaeon]|nr:DNA alkylation repair protein [Candidatus Aenigmarchaeota archaeon]NIP40551.1 DNA alkylation repair protein [Candidatus Aenigmarchaeota archaeon]NIQ18396.1 DNA alkylation repair protein [Candidatus Aenigmarchaeota archaeon]